MADNAKYPQLQSQTLAGSGCAIGAISVTLSSFADIDGNLVTMTAYFGTKGFATIEPNNSTREEQISFTGITQNANGSATLTGVSNVLFYYPYTETSGTAKSHPGGATLIITNTSGFYDRFTSKNDDETISGRWIFPSDDVNNAGIVADTDTVMATAFVTLGQLSRQAISGASNASTTVKGIVQLPTQAQVDARTTTGSTGALLALTPDKQRNVLTSDYVIDTGAANAYVIAPSPAITAYTTGQVFTFKATNTNTTASTINVNGLGAKNIFKNGTLALIAGDIVNTGLYEIQYDGTQFQMLSQLSKPKISITSQEIFGADAVGTDAYAITLVPAPAAYTTGLMVNFTAGTANTGAATLNVNGLGAKNITKNGTTTLGDNDIISGQAVSVIYDGTQFQMISQLPTQAVAQGVADTTATNEAAGTITDVTGGSITITTRARRVMLAFAGTGSNNTNADGGILYLKVDAATAVVLSQITSSTGNQVSNSSSCYLTDVLSAGSHTFKLQIQRVAGGTFQLQAGRFSAVEIN